MKKKIIAGASAVTLAGIIAATAILTGFTSRSAQRKTAWRKPNTIWKAPSRIWKKPSCRLFL